MLCIAQPSSTALHSSIALHSSTALHISIAHHTTMALQCTITLTHGKSAIHHLFPQKKIKTHADPAVNCSKFFKHFISFIKYHTPVYQMSPPKAGKLSDFTSFTSSQIDWEKNRFSELKKKNIENKITSFDYRNLFIYSKRQLHYLLFLSWKIRYCALDENNLINWFF